MCVCVCVCVCVCECVCVVSRVFRINNDIVSNYTRESNNILKALKVIILTFPSLLKCNHEKLQSTEDKLYFVPYFVSKVSHYDIAL